MQYNIEFKRKESNIWLKSRRLDSSSL